MVMVVMGLAARALLISALTPGTARKDRQQLEQPRSSHAVATTRCIVWPRKKSKTGGRIALSFLAS